MSVRFVVGRAGSGKTWRCLEAIRARLRAEAAEGHRLILLVPEQAGFQMERALIETPGLAGYCRCEVLSFQRLAYRIFAETGADPRRGDQTIGPLGRMMALRRLIRREGGGLRLLNRVADKPGLIAQVAHALEELMREDVAPQALADLAEQNEPGDPLVAAKLSDLARLYQAYLDYLVDDRLDPAQYLTLAADRLAACTWLEGAEVWVDGFAGFTGQEIHLLTKLARRVARMEITLLVDPSASAIDADHLLEWSYSLFARTERTLLRLRGEMRSAGVELEEPARLEAPPRWRFDAPELRQLEHRLFREASVAPAPVPRAEVIRVLELPDRRAEVDAALAEIQRLTREADPPMRYRDMAVIVRDLAPYHDLLSAALRAHGIACFIDRRQPTTHHPLIELVRALLAVAIDDCGLESVRLTLKTGLLPIAGDDADLMENYVLAHGIAGRSAWDGPWCYTRMFPKDEKGRLTKKQQAVLHRVNTIRKEWLAAVDPWLTAVAERPQGQGRVWAESLFGCLDRLEIGERLRAWADAAEDDGRPDEADAHRQVWLDFIELLDEFVRALGSEVMPIREFREILEAGLAEFNLGLAPPTLDQVLVGAIERSRHPPIRAALLLGFDEASYPLKRSEDPLLGDSERDALADAGAEIGPSRRRQLLDERMLAYVAMTRASQRLWISYPRAAEDGKPLGPSPFLADLLTALPGLSVEKLGDPRVEGVPLGITRVGELGSRLAGEFRRRPRIDEEIDKELQLARRAMWNVLYETARQEQGWRHTLLQALAGLGYRNRAELRPGTMAQVVEPPFFLSVSRLERFAACPFAHFAEYTLRLRRRVEAGLATVDLGTLSHAVLEGFVGQLAQANQRLADLEDDAIAERIGRVADEVMRDLADEMLLTEARSTFLCDRSKGHLCRVARWQRDAAKAGRCRPVKVEYPFGFSGDSAAPLTLTTPGGRTVLLRGVIDRVDVAELGNELAAVVIDYKHTAQRTLDLAQVYHGLALQLVGYLLALQQSGGSLTGRPIRPIAALYLPLLEAYESVPHPSQETQEPYRFRGIADSSGFAVLDETVVPGAGSRFLSARMNVDGRPDSRSDLATPAQFSALMRHVGRRMGELADRLLDGEVDVRPYRLRKQTPCGFCEYAAVCRYEIETQPPRHLDAFKKADVLDLVSRENADG